MLLIIQLLSLYIGSDGVWNNFTDGAVSYVMTITGWSVTLYSNPWSPKLRYRVYWYVSVVWIETSGHCIQHDVATQSPEVKSRLCKCPLLIMHPLSRLTHGVRILDQLWIHPTLRERDNIGHGKWNLSPVLIKNTWRSCRAVPSTHFRVGTRFKLCLCVVIPDAGGRV